MGEGRGAARGGKNESIKKGKRRGGDDIGAE